MRVLVQQVNEPKSEKCKYIPRNRIDLLTKKILTFLTANQMAAYRWSVRAARPIKLRVPAGASVGTFWADFNAA